MRKIRITLLAVTIIAMLFAAGCTGQKSPSGSEQGAGQAPSEPGGNLVSIDYLTVDIISNYTSLYEFIDAEYKSGDAVKILMSTKIAAKDFQYVEIGHKEEAAGIKYFVENVLHSSEALLPETPFITSWLDQGAVPSRGITYVDEKGAARCFYITASGENGSLMLVEFPAADSR